MSGLSACKLFEVGDSPGHWQSVALDLNMSMCSFPLYGWVLQAGLGAELHAYFKTRYVTRSWVGRCQACSILFSFWGMQLFLAHT
jgi:hypothetical protein